MHLTNKWVRIPHLFQRPLVLLPLFIIPFVMHAQKPTGPSSGKIRISMQKMVRSDADSTASVIVSDIQEWDPRETAIIVCDMWDQHWCKGATSRVAEMAPRLNQVLIAAREKGITIVHAPSDCMAYYKDHPARQIALKANKKKYQKLINSDNLDSEKGAVWPIDQSDGGCDEAVTCTGGSPWRKEIDALEIKDNDVISDNGAEIAAVFEKKGVKNVILTGVHTNMCVIGRTFGLRNMIRLGKNVVLMRDMTDAMYNSRKAPFVNHFSGVDLVIGYIARYVCPTMLSTDILNGKQFRFSTDKRPLIAFVTAEGEYRANQKLPEFAHELLLKEGVKCEFAVGKAAMDGPGRHNIENLPILEDADLAVFFVRRVALDPHKMQYIKDYVASGKPVLGIRTASHSFNANGNVPREGGAVGASSDKVSDFLAQWPEFDEAVLGGNYQGHHPPLKIPTQINIVPGMEKHPLLKGVPAEGFGTPGWLYQNSPLRSENAQVLLVGSIPGEHAEPVLWTNRTKSNNKVVYTSLGHWADWDNAAFHHIMVNAVNYLLGKNN